MPFTLSSRRLFTFLEGSLSCPGMQNERAHTKQQRVLLTHLGFTHAGAISNALPTKSLGAGSRCLSPQPSVSEKTLSGPSSRATKLQVLCISKFWGHWGIASLTKSRIRPRVQINQRDQSHIHSLDGSSNPNHQFTVTVTLSKL